MPSKAVQAKETARPHKYRLQFVPSAWAEWQKLDGSVKEPLRKLLKKRLDNPHVPGAALHGALAGHYKIKLNKHGYRLVYGVQDDVLIVMVMAVDKREDSVVYQSAMQRVTEKMAELVRAVQKRSELGQVPISCASTVASFAITVAANQSGPSDALVFQIDGERQSLLRTHKL